MRVAPRRALGLLLIAAVAVAAFVLAARVRGPGPLPARSAAERPPLLLLTSLPLLFGEDFSLSGGGSRALTRLGTRYRVIPISVSSAAELRKGRLLLMAHPLPQAAENLVALDDWVRGGGRLVLLADPLLEWPSERPLGDPLRPPAVFMDTGLLAHWGLRLDPPERRGRAVRELGGFDVITRSPGTLYGGCTISPDRLVARCRIGRGMATVIADADLLNADRLGPAAGRNLEGLLQELAKAESK